MRASRRSSSSSRRARAAGGALLLLLAAAPGCHAAGPTAADVPPFDGTAALRLVETQVDFGPRVPGTAAHAAALEWLVEELESRGAMVEPRPFTGVSALTGETFEGTNLVASFRPDAAERIFFGAHWDTRAFADRDPDPARRREPVPGAEDGGSGVAVLLVLAGLLGENPPPVGVDLLFFDGEDQGASGSPDGFCLGSRALAAAASLTGFRPAYGVVIDMVGHRDLQIWRDQRSLETSPALTEEIHALGRALSPERFPEAGLVDLYDDHIPFIDAGIRTVVLAGVGFPEWHTTADLPGICSAASLGTTGALLAELVWGGHEIP